MRVAARLLSHLAPSRLIQPLRFFSTSCICTSIRTANPHIPSIPFYSKYLLSAPQPANPPPSSSLPSLPVSLPCRNQPSPAQCISSSSPLPIPPQPILSLPAKPSLLAPTRQNGPLVIKRGLPLKSGRHDSGRSYIWNLWPLPLCTDRGTRGEEGG